MQRPCGRSILAVLKEEREFSVAEVEERGAACWKMETERQEPDHVGPYKAVLWDIICV